MRPSLVRLVVPSDFGIGKTHFTPDFGKLSTSSWSGLMNLFYTLALLLRNSISRSLSSSSSLRTCSRLHSHHFSSRWSLASSFFPGFILRVPSETCRGDSGGCFCQSVLRGDYRQTFWFRPICLNSWGTCFCLWVTLGRNRLVSDGRGHGVHFGKDAWIQEP